jgi:6-pyruvoyltetrahydropterin/6-carboxytetrahydropterin synthase
MKAYLTRRYWFSASHRLHNQHFSDAENRSVYGKCANPYGHGHNYALEVTVSGRVDARTGMVCNLVDLDGLVNRQIIERFGHENLNTLPQFARVVPTTENLCAEIYKMLSSGFAGGKRVEGAIQAKLEKIRLEETASNSFEYAGGEELPY